MQGGAARVRSRARAVFLICKEKGQKANGVGFFRYRSCLMYKLKVVRKDEKKGSKVKIRWNAEDQQAFDLLKERLCSKLVLQVTNPDKPFVFRVDASWCAWGATLEHIVDEMRKPSIEDAGQEKPCRLLLCLEN